MYFRHLTIGQPVLYRKTQHIWFPGCVICCHFDKSTESKNGSNQTCLYSVKLDSILHEKPEISLADSSSLALAISAFELRQKYPVGARVVCKF